MERIIWQFWEGPMPAWIKLCLETARAWHGDEVRLLSMKDFLALRGEDDKGVPLDHLHVAHVSDYVRGYLLHKFGGLWLDADCIVMRRLDLIFAAIEAFGFVGYGEWFLGRDQRFVTGLMGSVPEGEIIHEFREQGLRHIWRGKPLPWSTIGPAALTKVTAAAGRQGVPMLRLPEPLVHPIRIGQRETYWKVAPDAEHEAVCRYNPLTFMLTHRMLGPHIKKGYDELLNSKMLVSYLWRRSLKNANARA